MHGLLMNLTLLVTFRNSTDVVIYILFYCVIGAIAIIIVCIKNYMIKEKNRKISEERERKRQQLMYQQMMQQGMPPQGIQPMGMQQGVQQNLNQGMGPAEKGNGNTGSVTYTCGSCGADFESDEFPNFCPECGAGKENINRK